MSRCACGCNRRFYTSYLERGQSHILVAGERTMSLCSVACAQRLAEQAEPAVREALLRFLLAKGRPAGQGSAPRRAGMAALGVTIPTVRRRAGVRGRPAPVVAPAVEAPAAAAQ
jgi:hypothetical protein